MILTRSFLLFRICVGLSAGLYANGVYAGYLAASARVFRATCGVTVAFFLIRFLAFLTFFLIRLSVLCSFFLVSLESHLSGVKINALMVQTLEVTDVDVAPCM